MRRVDVSHRAVARTPGGRQGLYQLRVSTTVLRGVVRTAVTHGSSCSLGLGLAKLWSQFVIQVWRFSSSAKRREHSFEGPGEPDAEWVSNPEVSIARLDGDPAVEQVLLRFALHSDLVDGRYARILAVFLDPLLHPGDRVDDVASGRSSQLRALCSARRVLALSSASLVLIGLLASRTCTKGSTSPPTSSRNTNAEV